MFDLMREKYAKAKADGLTTIVCTPEEILWYAKMLDGSQFPHSDFSIVDDGKVRSFGRDDKNREVPVWNEHYVYFRGFTLKTKV